MPFRQNAPPPPPPSTREADELLAGELRRKSRRIALIVGTIVLLVLSPFILMGWRSVKSGYDARKREQARKLTKEERAELGDILPRAEANLTARAAAFSGATQAHLLSAFEPGARRCARARFSTTEDPYFQSGTYVVAEPADLPIADPASDLVRAALATAREKLASGAIEREDLRRAREVFSGAAFEGRSTTVVVADDHHAATIVGTGPSLGYSGGVLRGRAYVYDHEKQAIVCAGDIDVRNSEELEIEYRTKGFLDEGARQTALEIKLKTDLDIQTRKALNASLRAL